MKIRIGFIAIFIGAIGSIAFVAIKKEQKKNLFVVIYSTGSGWNASKPPNEQLYFTAHSQRLQLLRKENKILIGARYSDKGMIVMTGDTEAEIKEIVFADSAVISKTFNAEVYPYNVFYYGCLQKPE